MNFIENSNDEKKLRGLAGKETKVDLLGAGERCRKMGPGEALYQKVYEAGMLIGIYECIQEGFITEKEAAENKGMTVEEYRRTIDEIFIRYGRYIKRE